MIARRLILGSALVAGALALSACDTMKKPMTMMKGGEMSAQLSGSSEVPPTSTSGSGNATLKLDEGTKVLSWTVTYKGLSGPATAGHLHGPALPGANAGVVVPFKGSVASPFTGNATLTDAQIADLKAGKWYVNIHTAANPGGEIRGQVR